MTTTIDQDHERLLQRSIEEDTRILSGKYFRTDGIPFLLEKWTADGGRHQRPDGGVSDKIGFSDGRCRVEEILDWTGSGVG